MSPTSFNRPIEIGHIYNFSFCVCMCLVDGGRGVEGEGAIIILVFLWGRIKDWVSMYTLHLLTFPKTNKYLSL